MKLLSVSFDDMSGNIVIDWTEEGDLTPQASTVHQTQITIRGQNEWKQVAYYTKELRQDAEELLEW